MRQDGFLLRGATPDPGILHEHHPAESGRVLDPRDVSHVLVLRDAVVLGKRGLPQSSGAQHPRHGDPARAAVDEHMWQPVGMSDGVRRRFCWQLGSPCTAA
ncbi:hypothetical protein [Pseudofrankia sp. DC12]|uniref:hypothetical protein n=1 Tax=Pseudofrankia sp. DC12 TaxID=683315 RepID=UPI0012FC38FD|nr:hypothetical protein [Pseudofrankia sp. DC12]